MLNLLLLSLLLPTPWWQPPPEVDAAVQSALVRMLNPITRERRPFHEERQFRDRTGRLWLTLRRVGEDVREFNRDGTLVVHDWRQGQAIRCFALSPDGRWQQLR